MVKQKLETGRNWYAVHTYVGYEDAVVRNLKQRIESLGMEDKIFDVVVPVEKKIKIRAGKRVTIEEKIYPGYVLVDMIVTDDSWYVVRNTPRVTGFIGSGTVPVPLAQGEIDELFKRMDVGEPKYKMDINIGDSIIITDGPFKDSEGKVSEIDEQKGLIKAMVSMFGRETSVEIDFLQIKKV